MHNRLMVSFLLFLSLHYSGHTQALQANTDTISIKALSDGNKLDVLILKNSLKKTKLPAIIFSVGSGDLPWVKSYGNQVQFYFENTFLLNDFAVVYFDKRGVGNSEGIWYETTFEQRALDVKNVAIEIQKLDFIDRDRVFVIGHSQGGWITQIALSLYPDVFAGGVSMAGPTFGVRKQLINDYMSGYLCKGFEEDRAFRKAKRKVNRDLFLISLLGRKGNLKQLKVIKNFEPESYLKTINRPLLMLFAENDPLVNPQWSLDALKSIFPAGMPQNITYYIAQGEDHSFRIAPKCYNGSYKDLKLSVPTRDLMFSWVVELLANKY
ncbi:MAG TPA: alpha/beta fold hydrolase [Saprospiraceae bacterium]|nr:alpha/beta fold hydrolase [Saprospiraceae bacterium]HMP22768.1 alpha/beta fold hydrolase [Saprospiraceae bacterium]